MYRIPEYYRHVSKHLSDVLDDIGLNLRTVYARRSTGLLVEGLRSLQHKHLGEDITIYIFGSQTEGTTTLDLDSDTDILHCLHEANVIQELRDWKRDRYNLLMIQDETTQPGYCRLQVLRSDIPLAGETIFDRFHEYDDQRRVLVNNSLFLGRFNFGGVRHGPADAYGDVNTDIVHALPCKSWTKRALAQPQRQEGRHVSDDRTLQYLVQNDCLVVSTGYSFSSSEWLEWRISTSLAERYFMFCMNITQLRCYTLMKIIIKTFITPELPDTISSFHCKTILMHAVRNSPVYLWHEDNLLECVTLCLQLIHTCICINRCPHFFIPENNLFGGKIDARTRKKIKLAQEWILSSNGVFLFSLEIDAIGNRLRQKLSPLPANNIPILTQQKVQCIIHTKQYYILFKYLMLVYGDILYASSLHANNLISYMNGIWITMIQLYANGRSQDKSAVLFMLPSMCTIMGTVLSSNRLNDGENLTEEIISLFNLGVNSDVSSGRLKLASVLYCYGDLQETVRILQDVENRYDPRFTLPICGCKSTVLNGTTDRLPVVVTLIDNLNSVRSYFAFAVMFTRGEIYSVPTALQYEMFRCTKVEREAMGKSDKWMDCAVVDSLPYLFYLQYIAFNRLGRQEAQHGALNKLIASILTEPNLYHRETALNLLGQCMEQENRPLDALICYRMSLHERPTHNVARWLVCLMIFKLYHNA